MSFFYGDIRRENKANDYIKTEAHKSHKDMDDIFVLFELDFLGTCHFFVPFFLKLFVQCTLIEPSFSDSEHKIYLQCSSSFMHILKFSFDCCQLQTLVDVKIKSYWKGYIQHSLKPLEKFIQKIHLLFELPYQRHLLGNFHYSLKMVHMQHATILSANIIISMEAIVNAQNRKFWNCLKFKCKK